MITPLFPISFLISCAIYHHCLLSLTIEICYTNFPNPWHTALPPPAFFLSLPSLHSLLLVYYHWGAPQPAALPPTCLPQPVTTQCCLCTPAQDSHPATGTGTRLPGHKTIKVCQSTPLGMLLDSSGEGKWAIKKEKVSEAKTCRKGKKLERMRELLIITSGNLNYL